MSITETAPIQRRAGYSLQDDFRPIFEGKVAVPNFEGIPLAIGVATIAAGGGMYAEPGVRQAKLAGEDSNYGRWARYFLNTTQYGAYDGTGYVMIYGSNFGGDNAVIGRFAICKHEKIEGPGARPERGWHPGHCGKCGLKMSVDSGD